MSFRIKFGGNNRRRNRSGDGSISSGDSTAGTGCAVLFGLVFGCAGLAAAFFIGKMFVENVATYTWAKAPCELLSCEVGVDKSEKHEPFSLEVRYRYTFDGASYESSRYKIEENGSDDYTKLARKRQQLLDAGDGAIMAHVDPDDPANAILERGNLWFSGLMLLFPLPFLLIGFGIVWAALRSKFSKNKDATGRQKSLSATASKSGAGRWIGMVVFGVFFLVGVGLSYPLGVKPIKNTSAAKNWPETPCQVIWSRVLRHEGDDGDTFSVDIFYEYQFNEQTWRSNSYSFIGGSSSGRGGKQDIVKKYPEGSTQSCYVNPRDPFEAVLKPELGLGLLLGLIPLVFLLIGGGGLFAMLKSSAASSGVHRRGSAQSRDSASSLRGHGGGSGGGGSPDPMAAKVFKPGAKRVVGFFIALGIALFWNGIVSVFLWQIVEGFRRGNPEWFLTLFMIPFVLIGLAMIAAVFYTLMMQFNPKPVVTVTPGSPLPGDTLRVEWRLRSGSGRLRNLRLLLVGTEKATYRRGTNTHTDTDTFYRRVLAEAQRGFDLMQGEGRIDLPLDICPSVDLGNNEIEWSVKVEGEIPRWPDVDDSYVITVGRAGDDD